MSEKHHNIGLMNCIIFSRLSLSGVLKERWKKGGGRHLFWDPYSTNHGLLVSILIILFGRVGAEITVRQLVKLLGVNLQPVPHGDAIPDYHQLQLRAEALTYQYIEQYYSDPEYQSVYQIESFYNRFGIEKRSLDSMILKDNGYRLQTLVENIQVIKNLGYNSIVVISEKGSFPLPLSEILQRSEDVKYIERNSRNILNGAIAYVVTALHGLQLLPRLWKRSLQHRDISKIQVTVEFVDPKCANGKSTEPNYLSRHGFHASNMLAYVRREQVRRIGKRNTYSIQDNMTVLRLEDLKLCWKKIRSGWYMYLSAATMVATGSRSLLQLRKYIAEVDLMVDLDALFSVYHPKAHFYNTIPNGNATTRYDSGIVTGLCRRYAVSSMTYQSRVYYRHNIYYFFDVFDEFFMWGDAWVEAYRKSQFVEKFTVVGNIGLDSYSYDVAEVSTINVLDNEGLGNVTQPILAVFTADIDRDYPLHYTYDYTYRFMLVLLKAVGEFCDMDGHPIFSIHLKPKDPEHVSILLDSPEVQFMINKYHINLNMITNKRHDIESVIDTAERVVSIGFTTPGFDALGRGKPSVYFTPYKGIYNSIFDAADSFLVAHNIEELKSFLSGGRNPSNELLDSVLHCSGEPAGPRLVAATLRAIATRGD
jgi:hypothetical protein